jgi:CheY-like chemotaxis protein
VLAGGIAHDFNNILTSVTANLSIAAEEASAGEDISQSISEARRAASMARALTQQLLAFSKGGEPVKKVASVGEIVRESARFALSGAASDLDLTVANGLWNCEVDPPQIGRVIENLVINADQAMAPGGTVEVRVENATRRLDREQPGGEPVPARCVEISVADSGRGIREEDLQRVFDPYFTTKIDGSGLGLATVHNIVNRHGGRITVRSAIGEGTVFTVLLPAVNRPVRASTVPPGSPLDGVGRILVMDDDVLVQRASERVLTRLGYDVEVVDDGDSALAEYERARGEGRPFDLVIMDLVIPGGMGGKEAIGRLLEIDPAARAIVSSGYSTDPVMSDHLELGFKAAVSKPWSLEEIGRTIREVIEGG